VRRASCEGERTSCKGEKKDRGSKARRKDCRRTGKRGGKGAGGGDQHTRSLTVAAKPQSAAARPFPLLSLRPSCHSAWLLRPRLRTKHNCSAHDQLVFIASNTIGSYTKSIRRSPPHRRVVGGDAHLLVSYRQEIWKRSPKYHVATGTSENSVFQGRLPMLKVQIPWKD
jgi:hypothetical protein